MIELIKNLNNHLKNNNLQTAQQYLNDYDQDTWKNYIPIKKINNYYRNRVYKCSKYEIYIIFWSEKAKAKIP